MKLQIFLYKKSINLSRRNRELMEADGYIPIPVDDLKDAQILAVFPDVDNTWLLTAAMDLILDGNAHMSRQDISIAMGQKVMRYLRDRANIANGQALKDAEREK